MRNLLFVLLLISSCHGSEKQTYQTCEVSVKLDNVLIDHVLRLREDCRETRVSLFLKVYNPSDSPLQLNKGQEKYYCYWKDLKPFFVLKNSNFVSDSICLGFPNNNTIPPNTSKIVECVILNKNFEGSLNIIDLEISDWLQGGDLFQASTFETNQCTFKTIQIGNYNKTFKLDDVIISPKDSLNMNKAYKMSKEDLEILKKMRDK